MKLVLPFFLLGLITGCAGSQSTDGKYDGIAKNKDMVCEHTASTGSHMKKKKCMSRELAKEVREQNQRALREAAQKGRTSTTTQ